MNNGAALFCRQASLRMASASKTDPTLAAAAAAALEAEAHGYPHHRSLLHTVANHILHHGQHHGSEHATITVNADGTTQHQQSGSAAVSALGLVPGKGSPFASLDGQSKTAAAVLGDAGLAVAGVAKPERPATTSTAVVPAGWPASGAADCM